MKQKQNHGDLRTSPFDIPPDAVIKLCQQRVSVRENLSTKLSGLLRHESELFVRDIVLENNIFTVSPKTTTVECRELLDVNGYRRAMVVDNFGKLCGVVSHKDLNSGFGKFVGHVMTKRPVTTKLDTPLYVAMSALMHRRVSCLPVTHEGVLIGILTMSDLVLAFQELLRSISKNKYSAELLAQT